MLPVRPRPVKGCCIRRRAVEVVAFGIQLVHVDRLSQAVSAVSVYLHLTACQFLDVVSVVEEVSEVHSNNADLAQHGDNCIIRDPFGRVGFIFLADLQFTSSLKFEDWAKLEKCALIALVSGAKRDLSAKIITFIYAQFR